MQHTRLVRHSFQLFRRQGGLSVHPRASLQIIGATCRVPLVRRASTTTAKGAVTANPERILFERDPQWWARYIWVLIAFEAMIVYVQWRTVYSKSLLKPYMPYSVNFSELVLNHWTEEDPTYERVIDLFLYLSLINFTQRCQGRRWQVEVYTTAIMATLGRGDSQCWDRNRTGICPFAWPNTEYKKHITACQ